MAVVGGSYHYGALTFPAHGGRQWLDLTGTSKTATGIEHTFATTAGAKYTLTFFVGNIHDPAGSFGTSSTVDVFVGGKRVLSANNADGAGANKLVWKAFSTTFTASSSSTAIRFMNADPAADNNNGLDDVALQVA